MCHLSLFLYSVGSGINWILQLRGLELQDVCANRVFGLIKDLLKESIGILVVELFYLDYGSDYTNLRIE